MNEYHALSYFPPSIPGELDHVYCGRNKLRVIVKKSETIRDFFMILFFFVLGANVEFQNLQQYSMLIAIGLLFVIVVKPIIFKSFFALFKTVPNENLEISVRLGQLSEFSVIVVLLGASTGHIPMDFAMAIEVIMFLSIILSTYLVQYIPFYKFQKTHYHLILHAQRHR